MLDSIQISLVDYPKMNGGLLLLFMHRRIIHSKRVLCDAGQHRKGNTMARRKKIWKVPNIKLALVRFLGNPILKPNPRHPWETKAVFNPAAIFEGGKVHLLYRALGETDVSTLGYASSTDGQSFKDRLPYPVYVPRESFEGVNPVSNPEVGIPGTYTSGGGEMGGCEDPRLTRIDDKIYLTYVAYDGRSQPRVALSSIMLKDFLAKKWNWKKPVLISPPQIVDKNACILPEKINGKFVIFHRVFPNILIDFVDDLEFDGKSRWLTGQYEIPVRSLSSDWDSRKVGCGPPPLKTKDGWLLIYQAVGVQGEYRYKIGAMLLDLKDPTKVLARSREPILEPDVSYENEGWKAGVVYPCGAVIINERLFVYYGGADMVTCVASVKLNGFLEQLTENHKETAVKSQAQPPAAVNKMPESIKGSGLKHQKITVKKKPREVIVVKKRRVEKKVGARNGTRMMDVTPKTPLVSETRGRKAKGSSI
jgi:beta-1,2-mannobiose phosphorylase / 1,2-beta-oligomannan phosphorylase